MLQILQQNSNTHTSLHLSNKAICNNGQQQFLRLTNYANEIQIETLPEFKFDVFTGSMHDDFSYTERTYGKAQTKASGKVHNNNKTWMTTNVTNIAKFGLTLISTGVPNLHHSLKCHRGCSIYTQCTAICTASLRSSYERWTGGRLGVLRQNLGVSPHTDTEPSLALPCPAWLSPDIIPSPQLHLLCTGSYSIS